MSLFNQTRRVFMETAGLAAAGITLSGYAPKPAEPRTAPKEMLVYLGTYTTGKNNGKGIYICKMDMTIGALSPVRTVEGVTSPSFLATDRQRRYLYAVNEITQYEGKKSGSVSAFVVDAKTGNLTLLNRQPTLGGAPCYVTVDNSGKFVLVANYVGGNVSVFPVQKDGSLGPATEMIQHEGSGANQKRQDAPHAHNVRMDPANRFAYVSDLGIDKIMIYQFNAGTGELTPNTPPSANLKPGAGPRHLTFHPKGKFAYVINELNSTITAFTFDKTKGSLQELQTLSTLPADYPEESFCADIHISPDGKFLYGSNRGHNSIAVFSIHEQTGKLTPVDHTPTGGKWPRNFAIDPTGNFLLVANQNTDNVVVYRIDPHTGKLKATGNTIEVPAPVCILLAPATV